MSLVEFVKCDRCKQVAPSNCTTQSAKSQDTVICTACCASSSANPPTVDLAETLGHLAATPNSFKFIECFGIVQFDLQLGQSLEYLYPPIPLSVTQETELAFLCFPDANHVGDGDSFHDFVYAFNESESDPSRTTVKRATVQSAQQSGASSPREPRAHAVPFVPAPDALQEPQQASTESEGHSASSSPLSSKPATSPIVTAASPHGRENRKLPYDASAKTLFCSTLFRQRRDSSVIRGAQQKALVVMSNFAFPALFHNVLRVLCSGLFDGDSDPQTLLHTAWRDAAAWPRPLPGREYAMLPFLGEVLHFCSPVYDPFQISTSSWSNSCVGGEVTVHQQSALQRLREAAETKGTSSDALAEAITEYLASTPLIPREVSTWLAASGWSYEGRTFVDSSPLERRRSVIGDDPNNERRSSANAAAQRDVTPLVHFLRRRTPRVPRSGESVSREVTNASLGAVSETLLSQFRQSGESRQICDIQNEALKALIDEAEATVASLLADSAPLLRDSRSKRHYLDEIEIHAALFPHITKAWKLWELMIVGEPIAFLGPSAPAVSAMTLSMAAMIAPLHWTGLLRPYVTINNREIDIGIDKHPCGPTVVGSTNPFFARHLEAWPHMVCVSSDLKEATTHKTWPADSEKRQKQQFKLKNRMFCSRHYLVKTDKTWGGDITSVAPEEHKACFVDSMLNAPSRSGAVLQTFLTLTEEFLAPITAFLDHTMQRHQPYFLIDAELRRLLSHRTICDALANGKPPSSFQRFKNAKDALEVYQAFLLSATGQSWLQSQVRLHYRRFLLEDVSSLEDVIRITPLVTHRRTALSWLQWDLERCIDAPLLDMPLIRKLLQLCKSIVPLREALSSAN